ncbi:MAG: MGMT family protein, partial [Succinivibrionaceae bacterium]|nr:MGMT family protein [Succinivibrionaceae bacterium]
GGSALAARLWALVAKIPRGRTCHYRDLAVALGRPRMSRAVGRMLGANPVPILIPCHRVVPAAGGVGGYLGGAWRKEALLLLERRPPLAIAAEQCQNYRP